MRSTIPRGRLGFVLRIFILLTVLSGCSSNPDPAALPPSRGWSGGPLVMTRSGAVEGERDRERTLLWRAIPYAKPPAGELRWAPPEPPEPWNGVLRNRGFCDPCTQYSPVIPGRVVGSEDCLYLNVWRPSSEETGLPVYVWIHGGGNSIGSGTMVPDYLGHAVASRSNMVFVSLNYRLGPFGWFDGGNFGTLDIIEALEWIRDNIAAFGGDPDRVTVTGESAGGLNVLSLIVSPLASGLFHRAVVQSGAARTVPLEVSRGAAEAAAKPVIGGETKDIREALRTLGAEEVMRLFDPGNAGMIGGIDLVRDGTVIPENGFLAIPEGRYNRVPIILGSNKEELKLFLAFDRKLYRNRELYDAVGLYGSAAWKAAAVDSVARAIGASPEPPPVYAYRFDWGSPNPDGVSPLPGYSGRRFGACHTLEIPFFLGTDTVNGRILSRLFFDGDNRSSREMLSETIMGYLASFARTGDPNAGLPGLHWPRWVAGSGEPSFIVFDSDGDSPALTVSSDTLSRESVFERMREELPSGIYSAAYERLEDSAMSGDLAGY